MRDDRIFKYGQRLASEGLKTLDFFRSLTPEEWEQPIYTEASVWTTADILCHLLNAEQAFHHLLQDILHGGSGAPEHMDIDAFNEQQLEGARGQSIQATLDAFSKARVTTLEILREMTAADLDRVGRHPFLGVTTLDKMVQLIYRHTMLHQRDIRRVLDQQK
ncbi:MAG: DinB family protein [Anaerolineae bacterium]|nr:DinB family protein [Anaerolineae bacterium]